MFVAREYPLQSIKGNAIEYKIQNFIIEILNENCAIHLYF